MWTRAWRFQNVYAYAAIDALFAILWFAAFIAVAVWRGRGMGGGDGGDDDDDDEEDNSDEGGCANFEFGSERKCNVAGAAVGFGVIICVLFIATAVLSGRAVMEYKRTGVMPNGEQAGRPHRTKTKTEGHGNEDGVWSSNTNDLDHDYDDGAVDPRKAYGQVPTEDDHENLLSGHGRQPSDPFHDQQRYSGEDVHPGRNLSQQHSNNSLSIQPPHGYHTDGQAHSGADSGAYVAPSALSPSDYGNERIGFPQGNYGADFR